MPVGLDLEWEIPDHVIGEILVGRERIPVDATGTFSSGPCRGHDEVDQVGVDLVIDARTASAAVRGVLGAVERQQ